MLIQMIYSGEKEKAKLRMPIRTITIDKVPPKSCYIDRNRSNIVVSETFVSPNKEIMDELYQSAEKAFTKQPSKS